MARDFYIKKGDTLPSMVIVLSDQVGPVDLTGCTVRFFMKNAVTDIVITNASTVITNALGGQVRYDWTELDTNASGFFKGEFQITYPSGKKRTFPADRELLIEIREGVA